MFQTDVSDPSVADVQRLEIAQVLEVSEAGVANVGVGQPQGPELNQSFEEFQAGATHPRESQIQRPQVAQVLQMDQSRIGDLSLHQINGL